MRMYDLITKKKQGLVLTDEEIRAMVAGYTRGDIPDDQMAAMAMAICWQGMSDHETAVLTDAMANSGDTVDLSEFGALAADKHSTGGVGDKTTLIVAPLAAACGLKIAKMSGRGLGHTGGTVDKLESMAGYRSTLSGEAFFDQVRRIGIAVIGQSGNLTPADKKLYALRDVTATVDSIPLIVSSIMSKKLAAGAGTIVLDVKAGSGAFMTDGAAAAALAGKMVAIGKACGRKMAALVTNMDVPLGTAIGNALEVKEAIGVLNGTVHGDLRELCIQLAANMVSLSLSMPLEAAVTAVTACLEDGQALAKFKEWVAAQGADPAWVDDVSLFPAASHTAEVVAPLDGWIAHMDTAGIGHASVILGAGRVQKADPIDPAAGIILAKKTGDYVRPGDVLAVLHTNQPDTLEEAKKRFLASLSIKDEKPETLPLILQVMH